MAFIEYEIKVDMNSNEFLQMKKSRIYQYKRRNGKVLDYDYYPLANKAKIRIVINTDEKPVFVRTMQEILVEADYTKDVFYLCQLWDEMVRNKHQYPLTHLWFAQEHIQSLINKLSTTTTIYLDKKIK